MNAEDGKKKAKKGNIATIVIRAKQVTFQNSRGIGKQIKEYTLP